VYGAIKMAISSWTYRMGSMPFISTAIVYIPIIVCMPIVILFLIYQMIHFKDYFLGHSDYDINLDKEDIGG
jgi:putative effector of murein hydrolase